MAAASWKAKIIPTTCIALKAAQQYCGELVIWECHFAKILNLPLPSTVSEPVMAGKRPLCIYDGVIKELSTSDSLIGSETLVCKEVPVGAIDGFNLIFTLAYTPILGSELVFLNGILQNQGAGNNYTIVNNTITFVVAPIPTNVILVTYWK